MPRWLRVIRGMLGTGLTFTVGVAVVGLLFGVPVWLFGGLSWLELLQVVAKCAVVAFPIGVAFSGMLALTARGRPIPRLSVPRFAALGAAAGLLYFGAIGLHAFRVWSLADALANLAILTLLGSGAATAILLLARRAGLARAPGSPSLDESTQVGSLGAGVAWDGDSGVDARDRVAEGARRQRD